MVLDDVVTVKISPRNRKHYSDIGYDLKGKGRKLQFVVPLAHLPTLARTSIRCSCDTCGIEFKRMFALVNGKSKLMCVSCNRKDIYQRMDKTRLIQYRKSLVGDKNPNWKPSTPEFVRYSKKVRRLTEYNYNRNMKQINPNNYPRTLCGVIGGYQLDHILSIKEGFDRNIDPHIVANINNLQMLPWEENNKKG